MKRELQYLIIHCTATPENREVRASEIRAWHTAPPPVGHGWLRVGYTDMIHLDGRVERLQDNNEDAWVDDWEITNGASGYNNVSRHVVYVGGLSADGKTAKDTRTAAQCASLEGYVRDFHVQFPRVRIIGHNEVAAKACPSFDVQRWLNQTGLRQ